MRYMNMMVQEEVMYITVDTKPKELYDEMYLLYGMWQEEDPTYIPPSSSQTREFVAQLMRDKFYVVSGDGHG